MLYKLTNKETKEVIITNCLQNYEYYLYLYEVEEIKQEVNYS